MEIALEMVLVEEQKNIGIWSSMTLIFCDKCTWLCPKHVFICIFQAVQIDLAGLKDNIFYLHSNFPFMWKSKNVFVNDPSGESVVQQQNV